MHAYLISALLLLTAAPLVVRADEAPAPPPEAEAPATEPGAEELPYGTGYEARQRAARGEARPARGPADRAAAQREVRREARGQRAVRGPGGH